MAEPSKQPTNRAKRRKSRAKLSDAIEIRGAWQNNLKGVDLDLPLGQLIVVTGPSGSGKSSLAFQTIYAEGQRRYVETFSPYVRQFFDRMDKPQVDEIRGIPPAIAIEQANNVKTTRSTVGTITEINDYLKLLFPRIAQGYCPECGAEVQPDTPQHIIKSARETFCEKPVLVTFGIGAPEDTEVADFFEFLQAQGYVRVLIYGEIFRTDQPEKFSRNLPGVVDVIQDRIPANRTSRLLEAVETALHFGKGKVALVEVESNERLSFSTKWHCASCDLDIREPVAGLFSFNNPLGACPDCRGFGRVIGIDIERALPDKTLSIRDGVVKAFQGDKYYECQQDLERCAVVQDVDLDTPFEDLPKSDQEWILKGDGGDPEAAYEIGSWYGVKGFFKWVESKSYKMHVRVFLSRFRNYTECDTCNGTRLQPEALNFRVREKTLPELWTLSVDELLPFFEAVKVPEGDSSAELLKNEVTSRLGYLDRVGLGYLNLDRSTRTLSGGEVQRVNLTTCLGASLTNTLFVLDEPSIGLHPRDIGRLIEVMEQLRNKGNTLLVVEHEEAVIRAADHLVDVGPGRGEGGGEIVYAGDMKQGAEGIDSPRSLTRAYLTGDQAIPVPEERRAPEKWIEIQGARQHNLKRIDVKIPLGVFTVITGVSGSGKSTLVHDVLYQNILRARGEVAETEVGALKALKGVSKTDTVIMVDQSPLSKTPRSTPAVFTGVFEGIRKLFAATPDGEARGLTPGYFSFNSGAGRCERCWGTGFEKVEMQFLSDVFVTCPECEGKRYTPETLEVLLDGQSIFDVLSMTIDRAIPFFEGMEGNRMAAKIVSSLSVLQDVGLGYLRLGQPLNTLSGGEAQRLKLVGHLLESSGKKESNSSLLIFDEPTTGLHFDDVAMLLKVFQRLVENGDSILVIEHNVEVIKCADWVIDLGPEAGSSGGEIVAEGTPEEVVKVKKSHTAKALSLVLGEKPGTVRVRERQATYRAPMVQSNSSAIKVLGAREHNLKNVDLEIPRDEMVVITGLSGSGKSTLAFDILFAEGQRRFLDSMSTYARQFVEQMEKPDIDHVTGLPPTVAIEQRISRGGGKSTVATVTEVYHFLRLLFAKVGIQHSPATGKPVVKQSITAIVTKVKKAASSGKIKVMAPLVKARKGFHTDVAKWAEKQGYEELLVDGDFKPSANFKKLTRFQEHTIDVVIAEVDGKTSSAEIRRALETALKLGKQTAKYIDAKNEIQVVSTAMSCPDTGRSFEELDPRLFSYNSPHGWCSNCRGYGEVHIKPRWDKDDGESQLEAELREERQRKWVEPDELVTCPTCKGGRLNEVARHVRVKDLAIDEIARMSVADAREVVGALKFTGKDGLIARDILPEITQRLKFMEEVGLGYLQLDRSAKTLSGGESQRIRLAAQLGSNLRGVLYVLDEPTIGLHPRDNASLLDTLTALRDKGNSLVVVEHDEETMRRSNHVIDLGPGAGRFGGEVSAQGTLAQIKKIPGSATGKKLKKPLAHPMRGERRPIPAKNAKSGWIRIEKAVANNLKNVNLGIPVGRLTVLCGISGSGKSSFMRGVLQPAVRANLPKDRSKPSEKTWKSIKGVDQLEAVYEVDQSPIGKTSRSTPGTYIKVFDEIRKLYAQVPDARARGYTASRFSFNTEGGRCETCKGNGQIKLEMNFLPTSYVECEDCHGMRYNDATLEILYNGKNIGQVMLMSIDEAAEFFEASPRISRTLGLLCDTGLGYLQLGQPSPTLSGGEAQRIKLVSELTRGVGRSQTAKLRQNRQPKSFLYLIEEPSIGLHMQDVERLLEVLHRLVDDGATVVVIEHNLDIVAEADYVIEIGPEAGEDGGEVVAACPPEQLLENQQSRTAPFLKTVL